MKTALIFSTVVLGAASLTVSAEDFSWGNISFQPRAYAGYANYMLESGDFTYIENGNTFRGPFNFDEFEHHKIEIKGLLVGLGGTVAVGRFFGDIYYQSTPNETAYSSAEFPPVVDDPACIPLTGQACPSYYDYKGSVTAQHADWAVSLGYAITDQWSVFAGYKSGNTEWDQYNDSKLLPPESGLLAASQLDSKFDQDGPFLGTSYSFLVGPGVLTLKAAYAYLDGNFEWSIRQTLFPGTENQIEASRSYNLNGNSNAYSLGVSWTQSISDNFGYSIGANYHNYKFDMSGTSTGVLSNTPESTGQLTGGTLTEELFTLTASLFYRF